MAEAGVRVLTQPVRGRVVLKYFAQLCLALSVLTLVPLCVSIVVGEFDQSAAYVIPGAVLVALGLPFARMRAPSDLRVNEALVIPALVFLVGPFVLCVPMMLAGVNALDALFEAVSGVTTTGLSALATVEDRSRSFLFARAWLQWIGGLGIVALALALFIGPGTVARRLAPEYVEREEIVASTHGHARRVVGVYLFMTVIGVALLWLEGLSLFDAGVHTLAAVSTGGFSSHDASLAAFQGWLVPSTVTLLCLAGSISFGLYYGAAGARVRRLATDPEVQALLLSAGAIAALLLLLGDLTGDAPWAGRQGHAVLLALSAQTTAGFASVPVADLDPASKLVLILGMAVGGDVGSTAGGVKIVRLLILMRVLQGCLLRPSMPSHAVHEVRLGGHRMTPADVEGAITIVLLFLLVVLASWVPFLAFGYNPIDALFEVVSAAGTVGLSTGLTRPDLEPVLKGILCFDMWMGRLEMVALLIVLRPRTWIQGGGRAS